MHPTLLFSTKTCLPLTWRKKANVARRFGWRKRGRTERSSPFEPMRFFLLIESAMGWRVGPKVARGRGDRPDPKLISFFGSGKELVDFIELDIARAIYFWCAFIWACLPIRQHASIHQPIDLTIHWPLHLMTCLPIQLLFALYLLFWPEYAPWT